jgi:SAM-dependent methyltransferase
VQEKVSHLYNKLFEFERKIKRLGAYPIHKKLKLPEQKDIYDLLVKEYHLQDAQSILDAGCGVGFGSLKIAKETQAKVLGISVSPLEIVQANKNLRSLQHIKCSFEVMSFEDVPKNEFDAILCVESLKHAIPIHRSVEALLQGLKAGGRLIVVDDFYTANLTDGKTEKTFIKDWRLDKLIQIKDLPVGAVRDITKYMEIKSIFSSRVKLLIFAIIRPFVSKIYVDVFRGGVHLDILYNKEKMKYMVYEFKKAKY